jgi:hypothetical protein
MASHRQRGGNCERVMPDWWDGIVPATKPRENEKLWEVWKNQSLYTCECSCNDGWRCEEHPDRGWPHGDCVGPAVPCPVCNAQSPPRLPEDWVSIARINEGE